MRVADLVKQIEKKSSVLSVGLDPVLEKLPRKFQEQKNPLYGFSKDIVDATHKYAIAFKINTAFFEAYGHRGWEQLENLAHYIKEKYPEILLIADAKRGDIAHTSKMYARAFFEQMPFDAITVNPYLGKDAIMPFLEYHEKWVIVLGLTSNPSAWDIQLIQEIDTRDYIFEKIFKYGAWWGDPDQIMFVAGATFAYKLQQIRHIVPNHFLLVPGVGAQGGSLEDVMGFGLTENYGLIVNSSRSIIYASSGDDYAQAAAARAHQIQGEMAHQLDIFRKSKRIF